MIERFVEEYADKGYQFAFHLCGDQEQAKELVQEAFYRVIAKWESYYSEQPLENWFMTIVRNLYYDGMKRYDRRHGLSLDAPHPDSGRAFSDILADAADEPVLERLERREEAAGVEAALAALTPEHRAILTLGDMQGLGYEELAAALDCPLGTVRSRLFRARAAFKKALTGQGAGKR